MYHVWTTDLRSRIIAGALAILTMPRYVRVSTEYVVVNFDDSNSRSLPITLGVECGSLPTICLSMVTPHKITQERAHEDWVQIEQQRLHIFLVL